jgi:hypothetical protein
MENWEQMAASSSSQQIECEGVVLSLNTRGYIFVRPEDFSASQRKNFCISPELARGSELTKGVRVWVKSSGILTPFDAWEALEFKILS